MKQLLLALAIALAVDPLLAQPNQDGMKKYADYTPERISALSKKERQSLVPIAYNHAANTVAHPAGATLLAGMLNELMYPGLADFDTAVRQFQKDIGKEPTGVFSVSDIHNLNIRSRYQRIAGTVLYGFAADLSARMDGDFATVAGTVKILDERIAHPVNRVTVDCNKKQRYCTYRQQVINIPDENDFTLSFRHFSYHETIYNITEWTDSTIRASPINQSGCRVTTLDFNFQNKEFYEIARNNKGECKLPLGQSLPKLDKPRISQIVDGNAIARREFAGIKRKAYSYLSSDYRKKVESFLEVDKRN
jgi:hypothetical protein